MRPIIQELKTKFSGTNVFIIGGGNSIRDFDFSRLEGRNVIAVNSAYKFVGADAVIYWGDGAWGAENERTGLSDHPSKYKFSARLNIDSSIQQEKTGPAGCYWLKKTGSFGYDSNESHVRGNNSGGNAINFAINLGAARVILMGFDMGYINGKSHFHNEYQRSVPVMDYNDVFIPSLESLAKNITHLPVKVINCNSESRLRCFEFGNVEDYL